jgi:hypothetical protein
MSSSGDDDIIMIIAWVATKATETVTAVFWLVVDEIHC